MIVDSSALIAILFEEPEGRAVATALLSVPERRISAATLLETAIVVESRAGQGSGHRLDLFVSGARIVVESVTAEQVGIARQGWRDFGRGSGHPAKLNFGDCFSYALARIRKEPLLCIGGDFAATDIPIVPLIRS